MRTITLSNHAADELDKIQRTLSQYQEYIEDFNRLDHNWYFAAQTWLKSTARKYWDARDYPMIVLVSFPLLVLLYYPLEIIFAIFMVLLAPTPPTASAVKPGLVKDREIWQAGGAGEKKVKTAFSNALEDDFVHISGYMNRKGEIDQIIIGPKWILCMEIKYVAGTVHCNGDRWWRDKRDRHGNVVQSNTPIADKGGRGPSRQVNEAAIQLRNFLSRHVEIEHLYTAVVFSHEQVQFGEFRHKTVDFVFSPHSAYIKKLRKALDGRNGPKLPVEKIAALICKEHAFHAERNARRQRNQRPTRQMAQ